MSIQKIKSGRIITVNAGTYVGEKGTIFYDENLGDLRLSDGLTPGGISLLQNSGAGTTTIVTVYSSGTQINRLIDISDVNSTGLTAGSILVYNGVGQWNTTLTIPSQSNIDAGEF